MQTTLTEKSPVDHTLDIHATADDLQPHIDAKLRERRKTISMKGFRPGKAPLSLVRKMYGEAAKGQAAEELIGEALKTEVNDNDAFDVIGQPRLTEFTFEGDDLHASIDFSTRPAFDLADLSGRELTKFTRDISDEELDAELDQMLDQHATEEDAGEGTEIAEDHVAVFDIQKMDRASGEPVEGDRQEGARAPVKALLPDFQAATLGKKVGDTFTVELPGEEEGTTDPFEVEVKAVRTRTLPELDAAFIQNATGGQAEDEDGLRTWVRGRMEESWENRTREFMEAKAVQHVLDAHDFAVPNALVESLIDGAVEEKRDEDGRLPEGFDVAAFREERRSTAVDQAKWMLVKEKIVEADGIKLTEEDFDAEIGRLFGDQMDPQMAKQFIVQQEGMVEQIARRLENRRLFDALFGRMSVVEKSRADVEAEAAERQANTPAQLVMEAPAEAEAETDEA
jgi:trigger factor